MALNAELIKELIERDKFIESMGIKVLDLKEGYSKISIDFEERFTRIGGMFNGGVTATLMDTAGGAAVLTTNDGRNQVTVNLDISFLNPIIKGPVSAEATVTKRGRSVCFSRIEVFDGDGKKCAEAQGIWYLFE